MSIKYKAIQRAQPGVPGGGEKKYYAIPVLNGEYDIPEFLAQENVIIFAKKRNNLNYNERFIKKDRIPSGIPANIHQVGNSFGSRFANNAYISVIGYGE
jgi:hypothetical protein